MGHRGYGRYMTKGEEGGNVIMAFLKWSEVEEIEQNCTISCPVLQIEKEGQPEGKEWETPPPLPPIISSH